MKIYSFPPIADSNSKVLVLGTMPGKDSLKFNQYYAHSRNAFWKIMFELFEQPYSNDYQEKQRLLLKHNIALWDTLKVCVRETSLDTDIKQEEPNDVESLLLKHSKIQHLFFNGHKAAEYFRKHWSNTNIPFTVLPSTSPANTQAYKNKLSQWQVIRQFT